MEEDIKNNKQRFFIYTSEEKKEWLDNEMKKVFKNDRTNTRYNKTRLNSKQ
jgi:hypothetical protein